MPTDFQGSSPVIGFDSNSSILLTTTTNFQGDIRDLGRNLSFSAKAVNIVKRPNKGQIYPRTI
jgi:hypothetical protein